MEETTPKLIVPIVELPLRTRKKRTSFLQVITSGSRFDQRKKLSKFLRPTLRSQVWWFTLLILSTYIVVQVSVFFPESWIHVPLVFQPWELFSWESDYHFPILGLIPVLLLLRSIWPVLNCEYLIDSRGIQSREGILWFNFRQPRLRYEDIRGVEIKQSILDRILVIGDLVIGSAAAVHEEGEIVMKRINDPQAVQQLIQKAIDRKKRSLARTVLRGTSKTIHHNKKRLANGAGD